LKADYLPSFIKDLKALRGAAAFSKIQKLAFEEVARWDGLEEIAGVKRLRGYSNAYRIRVGDYRIGFFSDGQKVTFARVLHRKEIYRFFP
jgi:mRNA interferase RelE/StbE